MKVQRSMGLLGKRALLGMAGAGFVLLPSIATAQVSKDTVVDILLECAKIDDPTARLACFDNNIRSAGGPDRSTVPGQVVVQGGGAPIQGGGNYTGGAPGFGGESVRGPERFQTAPGEVDEIRAKVASVRERQPNTYDVTLEDGALWRFSQSVSNSYRPPRPGSIVEIQRAALGSFLLVYDGQAGVRVRRVR